MGFFNHDDDDDRKAFEQVQQAQRDGNEAHLSTYRLLLFCQPTELGPRVEPKRCALRSTGYWSLLPMECLR